MLACDDIKKEEEEDPELFVKKEVVSEDEEGEDDGVSVKNEVFSEVEGSAIQKNSSKTQKRARVGQRYCAYCYEMPPTKNLINVPKYASTKQCWIRALGPQFEKFILQDEKCPMICRKHFYLGDFDKRGRKKSFAIPHRDEVYEGRKFEDYKLAKNAECCAYCLKFKDVTGMKQIVTDHVARGIWCRKLGDGFRERVESGDYPHICKSHFPKSMHDKKDQLIQLAAPLKLKEVEYLQSVNCAYCYILNNVYETVPVPIGTSREKWVAKLGKRFEKNLAIMESPTICKSHFYNYDGIVSSGGVALPIPDEYIVHLEMIQQLSFTNNVEMNTDFQKFLNVKLEEENNHAVKRSVRSSCLYCHNSNSPLTFFHKIFFYEKLFWNQYSKVFGLQFKCRLKNAGLFDWSNNLSYYKLCKRHFNSRGEAVPDKNSHYSVDELLDHNYADYTNQRLIVEVTVR